MEPSKNGVEFVVALYNYCSRSRETELSYRKGDVLTLLRPPDDSGWWYGRHATTDGAAASGGAGEGLFAHNYVKPISKLEPYVGKHAFRGKGDDDAYLPFAQGDRLEVVLPDSSGWWLARRAGGARVGLVPANYIAPAAREEEEEVAVAVRVKTQQQQQQEEEEGVTHSDRSKAAADHERKEAELDFCHSADTEASARDPAEEISVEASVEAKAVSSISSSVAIVTVPGSEAVLPSSPTLDAALARLLPLLSNSNNNNNHRHYNGNNAGRGDNTSAKEREELTAAATDGTGAQEASSTADLVTFLRAQLQRREQFAAQLADLLLQQSAGGNHTTLLTQSG